MKILFFDIGSYTKQDLIYYFQKMNIDYHISMYKLTDFYQDAFFEYKLKEQLALETYDCVFSVNFFPIIAKLCYEHHLKYLSWTYDSPLDFSQKEYYLYETNYLFLFDRVDAENIISLGAQNVFHLPLAVNCDRLDSIAPDTTDIQKFGADVSFVGQFYNSPLSQILQFQDEYTKGFVAALLQSQAQIYGCNLLSQVVDDSFVNRFNESLANAGIVNKLTRYGLINTLLKQVTHTERIILLDVIGEKHKTRIYSDEVPSELSHLPYGGTVYYHSEMPLVFKCSKLNLCPTLRCIESGIPLRALDIMGCKSVLFSSYQPELAEVFEDGKDYIMYTSLEEAIDKADYYLSKGNLLSDVAESGYKKVKANFSYPDRIHFMLQSAGLL